jgi:DNA-binding CsgD family transcriptional regulator
VPALFHLALLAQSLSFSHRQVDTDPSQFTSRELEWLRILASGATATLAEYGGYSARTMYRRLADLYARLGVNNRCEAVTHRRPVGSPRPDDLG